MRSPILDGEYHVRLDEKRRLLVPPDLLQRLDPADTTIYLRFAREAIDLYPGQCVREVLGGIDVPDDATLRLHFGTVWKATRDVTGRIAIPEELLRLAGISMTEALVLIGLRDHLELTTQTHWDGARARLLGRFCDSQSQ